MPQYDVIHFEALGEESVHLEEETRAAINNGMLPADLTYLITPQNVQEFLKENPYAALPPIITTKTHSKLPLEYFTDGKKSIVTRSAGYDHFEHLARIANVTSLREYCVNAVAQTAVKFVYAAAGELDQYTNNTLCFERNKTKSFMELGGERTATVFGVGKIGKRIYDLLSGTGLKMQAVDIREKELAELYGGSVNFVTKEQAIKNSDIMVNAMNLTREAESPFYNVNYFSYDYLSRAVPGLIFVNVTRGEIAPESALLKLYDQGVIRGIGLDVFTGESEFADHIRGVKESANEDVKAAAEMVHRSIDRSANIYVQPHQAFNSDAAAVTKAREAIKHVAAWYKNAGLRFDEQLPYYTLK